MQFKYSPKFVFVCVQDCCRVFYYRSNVCTGLYWFKGVISVCDSYIRADVLRTVFSLCTGLRYLEVAGVSYSCL